MVWYFMFSVCRPLRVCVMEDRIKEVYNIVSKPSVI